MSLKIYRSADEVPSGIKVVDNNDLFFNARTLLSDTDLVSDILSVIDKAKYSSGLTFIGRTKELGALNKLMLSTGTKKLLNIISYPDRCFNVVECGNNVLHFIPKITEGYILWEYPLISYNGVADCNIEYKGRQYKNFYTFLERVSKEDRDA